MMWNKTVVFAAVTVLCLFFSVVFSWGKALREISLEEVLSVGSLEDDILFQWVGIATDSQNNIYVTDGMDYTLKKFDPNGKLLKETGRKGQGPGEFLAPRLVHCSETQLYVTDQYLPGIQVFDNQLNFIKRIPLKIPVSDVRVLSDGRIAVTSISVENTGKIFLFDREGNVCDELRYLKENVPFMMDMVSFDFDKHGNVYLAFSFQDRVEKLDKTGKTIWSVHLLKGKKANRRKISSFVVPSDIVYKDIALDSSGCVYVLGGHFSENRGRDVYVLGPDGKHMARFALPDTSHCIHIDDQDYLYVRANDGVTLKKYRMHFAYEE